MTQLPKFFSNVFFLKGNNIKYTQNTITQKKASLSLNKPLKEQGTQDTKTIQAKGTTDTKSNPRSQTSRTTIY